MHPLSSRGMEKLASFPRRLAPSAEELENMGKTEASIPEKLWQIPAAIRENRVLSGAGVGGSLAGLGTTLGGELTRGSAAGELAGGGGGAGGGVALGVYLANLARRARLRSVLGTGQVTPER